MKWDTLGVHLREARLRKKWRQEDLAEKTGLSTNYIGAMERGEKIPSLETLVTLLNTLEVPSNVVLRDVVSADYAVKASLLSEKIEGLSQKEKEAVYAVVETMISHG